MGGESIAEFRATDGSLAVSRSGPESLAFVDSSDRSLVAPRLSQTSISPEPILYKIPDSHWPLHEPSGADPIDEDGQPRFSAAKGPSLDERSAFG